MASALVMPADAERQSAHLILRQSEGRIVVLEPITRCKKVALLDVDSNFITDRQLAHLHHQNCMVFLSLRANNIGHFGFQPPAPDTPLTLQRLRVLRLDRNQLSSMPGPWLSLPSLSVLTLDENHITGSGPAARCELPSLTALRVRANGMTSLAALAAAAMPSLATLDLDGNRLVSLSGLDGQLPGLTHLSVKANRLMMLTTPLADDAVDRSHTSTQSSVSTTRASALSLPLLETLRVDCNSLSDITAIRGCRRLVRLYARFNALHQWPQLSELSRTLQVLDISHNRLIDASLPSLSQVSSLVSLRMGYNRFTDAAKVAEAVGADSLPRLVELDTRGNPCCATFYAESSATSRLPSTSFALTDSLDISRHSSIHTLLSLASLASGGGAGDGNVSVASSRHSTPGRASRGAMLPLQAPVPVEDTPLFEVQWPDRDDSPLLVPSDMGQPLIYFPGTQSQLGSGLEDETTVLAAALRLPPFEMHSPVGAGAPQSIILARAAFRGTILLHAGGHLQALDGYRVAPEEWVRVGKGPLQQQLARQHDSGQPSSSSVASVGRPALPTSQVQSGANRRASIGKAGEMDERSRGRRGSWESSLRPFLGPGPEPRMQATIYGRRHSISKQQDLEGSSMKDALQYHRSPEQGKIMTGVPLGVQSGTYRDVGDVSQPAPPLEMPAHPTGLAKPILAQGHTVLQEDGMSYRAVSPPPPVHEQAVGRQHSHHQAPPQHAWSSFVPLPQSSPPDMHAHSPGFAGGQEVVFVRVRAEKQDKMEDAVRSGDVQEAAVIGPGHAAPPAPLPQTQRPASDARLGGPPSAPSQPHLPHAQAQAVIPATLDSSVTKSVITAHDSGDRSSLWSTSGLWELAARARVGALSPRPSMSGASPAPLPPRPAPAREALDSGTTVSAATVASSDVPVPPVATRPPDRADTAEQGMPVGVEAQGRGEKQVQQPAADKVLSAHFVKRPAELGKVHLGTFRDVNEARRARLAATCQRRTPAIPGHGPDPAQEAAHIVAVVAALSESALAAQHAAEEAAEAATSAALHASRAFATDTSSVHPLPARVVVKEQETQVGGISEEVQAQADRVQQVLHQHLPGHRCEACLHSVLSQQHREREYSSSMRRSLRSTSPARQPSRDEAIVAVALNTVDGGSKAPVALSSTPLQASFSMLTAADSLAGRERVHSPRWIPSGQSRTSTTTGRTRSSATSPVDLVAVSVPGSNPSRLPQATAARAAYHVVKAVAASPGQGTQRPTIAKSRRALTNRVGAPTPGSSSSVSLLQSSLGLPLHARVFADGRDYGLPRTSQQTSKILIHMAPDPVPPTLPAGAGQPILHERLHLQPSEHHTQLSPSAPHRRRLPVVHTTQASLSALRPQGGGDYRLDQSLAAILDEIDAAVSQKRAVAATGLAASVGQR